MKNEELKQEEVKEQQEVKEETVEETNTEEVKAEETKTSEEKVSETKTSETKSKFFGKKADEKQQLQKQIDDLTKELAVTKNAYYKAYADTENLKKRLLADADTANKYRIQSFALNILPALDALEIALSGKDLNDPFVKGVKLTYDSIMNALKNEGVEPIDCLNKPFDSKYHHAIMTEKVEGVDSDIVIEVMQKGYMLKDRLLRAALVKVSE